MPRPSHRSEAVFLFLLFAISCLHAGEDTASLMDVVGVEADASSGACLTAVFFPRRQAELSAEVSARVAAVQYEMGARFEKGDVLVTLDDSRFKARVARAEADVRTAKVNLEAVDRLYRDQSKSRLELAEAKGALARAEADLAVAKQDLDACTVKAPYAGRVVSISAREHELVQRGEALLSIVDDSVLRARFLAAENDLPRLRIGQTVSITVPVLKITENAAITHISPVIDPASRTVEVFAEVENRDGAITSGMIGTLRLADGAEADL